MTFIEESRPVSYAVTQPLAHQWADTNSELAAMLERLVSLSGAGWAAVLTRQPAARYGLACAVHLLPATRNALMAVCSAARLPAPGGLAELPWRDSLDRVYLLDLCAQGTALGLLAVGFPPDISLDDRRRMLLEALADNLRLHLQSTRLQQRIERLTGQLAAINVLGQRMTSILDRQHLFQQITHVICDSLGYDHTQLLLINEQRTIIELVHASGGAGAALLRQGFQEQVGGKGIIGWVAGSGQTWVCNDVTQDPHYQYHCLLPHTASEIALPVKIGDQVIGVLDVQCERPNAFDSDDVFLLRTVADQIALALEYARLFAAEHHERELATTLRDVSRIICSSLDLEQVLDLILQQLDRVVPHIGTRITLRTEGNTLKVVAAKGYPDNEAAKQAIFQIEDAPLVPLMLFEGQTVVVEDAHTDPRWIWLPGATQIRSWCGTPLVIKGRAIGWLCVDWGEPGFYTEAHARIVRAFADQAAVAIENARLYAALTGFNEQLEQMVQQRTVELRQARDEIAAQAAQLRALVHRVVKVQEAERQRIAHDLHDSITQAILAVMYELQALRQRLGGTRDIDRRLDECQQLLDSALLEMKHIIYALRPRALDELGLLAALENFVASTRNHHTLDVAFQVTGTAYALPGDVELAIYRIVQEATQNCIRHAGAQRLTISVEFRPDLLRVMVCDDGRGFEPEYAASGLGLASIRERAQVLGGQLQVRSVPGGGTQIVLELQRAVMVHMD